MREVRNLRVHGFRAIIWDMKLVTAAFVAALLVSVTACQLKENEASGSASASIPAPPDVTAAPANALRTASGIASKVLIVGLGSIHPTPRSMVTVHYTGWTTDGKMFDSSLVHGGPQTFPLNQVVPGWTEALQLMVVGEKRRF